MTLYDSTFGGGSPERLRRVGGTSDIEAPRQRALGGSLGKSVVSSARYDGIGRAFSVRPFGISPSATRGQVSFFHT